MSTCIMQDKKSLAKNKNKELEFKRQLRLLEMKAKDIRKFSFIFNTILGNACYSEKEEEKMMTKGQNLGNLTDDEIELLHSTWDARRKMTKTLMIDLKELLNEKST